MGRSGKLEVASIIGQNSFVTPLLWFLTYLGLDYVSFIDSFNGLAITPWSPAAGLALSLVLLGGWKQAPVVLFAPAIAGVVVRGSSVPLPLHVLEGVVFGGSYLAVGLLARRLGGLDLRLSTLRDAQILILTAICAATVAALGYVGVVRIAGFLTNAQIIEAFVRFVIGDLIGMLIVTPLVLLAASGRLRATLDWHTPAQLLAIALAFAAIFGLPHAHQFQLFYLLFVPLLWSAFRSGIAGAAMSLGIIQLGLILIVNVYDGTTEGLTSYQTLMIWLAASGLVFGSLIDQQRATALRLRNQQLVVTRALRLRSIGEMASAIAHEVNQPLTSIRTFAGVAREALRQEQMPQAMEALDKLRSECDRASQIVRATRDALKQRVVTLQSVPVAELLQDVENLLADRLSSQSVSLVHRIDDNAKSVIGDRVQLTQALYNIVENSLDAIEPSRLPGTISVSVTAPEHGGLEISVRDSGPGFAGEVLELGVTPLMSTKAHGSGIGLSIARSVAEAHGGALLIEPEGKKAIVKLRVAKLGSSVLP